MTLPLIYKGIIHFRSGARKQILIFGDLLVSAEDTVSAADTKGITMQKLSTTPFRAAKKTERKVGKGKGKETRPGSCKNPLRPRACATVGGIVLNAPQRKSNENLVLNPLRRAFGRDAV